MRYSVIIPTYNRGAILAEAIASVLAQDCPDLELIVVDDGSTDDTRAMLERRFPQAIYLHQTNRGPAAARNRGVAAARGDYIAFLDSDDLWLPGKIARERALFKVWPNACALAGNGSCLLEGRTYRDDFFAHGQVVFSDHKPRFHDWRIPIMTRGPTFAMSALTIRAKAVHRLGATLFDPSLRFDEDWDMEFRLSQQCRILLYPEKACRCRIHDDGSRSFYSIPTRPKSDAETRRILDIKIGILRRHADAWRRDKTIAPRFEAALAGLCEQKRALPQPSRAMTREALIESA